MSVLGHVDRGIGMKTAFKAFTEATPAELTALCQLGIEEMPSADVVSSLGEVFVQVHWHKKDLQTNTAEKTEVEALQEPTWGIDKIPQLLVRRITIYPRHTRKHLFGG